MHKVMLKIIANRDMRKDFFIDTPPYLFRKIIETGVSFFCHKDARYGTSPAFGL
jgi:hypothetical protein